jgi:hypothetical protein
MRYAIQVNREGVWETIQYAETDSYRQLHNDVATKFRTTVEAHAGGVFDTPNEDWRLKRMPDPLESGT